MTKELFGMRGNTLWNLLTSGDTVTVVVSAGTWHEELLEWPPD
jgi:hypothetical protein